MKEITTIFKALNNDTNLRIINVLLSRECCVCEVMQAMEISQSKASRHLSMLYNIGFLKLKKDGIWSVYYIDTNSLNGYLYDLLEIVKKALIGNKIAELDLERLKFAERIGLGYKARVKGKKVKSFFCPRMKVICTNV